MKDFVDWERTRRRARIATGRAGRTAFGRGLGAPCLFLHLPKCGGTALAEALHATVPLYQRVGAIDALATRRAAAVLRFDRDDPLLCHEDLEHGAETFALRERLLLVHQSWGTRLIHGHVLLSDRVRRRLPDSHRLVTVLRHPVERAISNFRMAAGAGVIPPDADAWLAGPVGRRHATVNLRYLGGRSTVAPGEEAACLAQALAGLEALALVGFLDRLPRFAAGFAGMFGARIAIGRRNEARGPEIALSRRQRQRLETLCGPDIVVHDRALARFG